MAILSFSYGVLFKEHREQCHGLDNLYIYWHISHHIHTCMYVHDAHSDTTSKTLPSWHCSVQFNKKDVEYNLAYNLYLAFQMTVQ